ncbi:MAG: S41 family peptidase [Oscillospiraceae bacterium]|nr:S41 family peptidase [Oscillospiraceae bacterium]
MEEKEKINLLPYILAAVIGVLSVLCALLWQKNDLLRKELADGERLAELSEYVDENYYQDTDEEALMDSALKGYVAGLGDPYSNFLTEDEYGGWKEKESGASVGIGVTVQAEEDGLLVMEVTSGSPAEIAGIQTGDTITAVDGELVTDLGFSEAVAHVKGEIGTDVVLTVLRDGEDLEITVTRGEIITISAEGQMLEENIGYIHISAFRENTFEQYSKVLNELLEAGAEGIIFDVRNNGGGLLSALEDVLDPLLPEGNIAIANYGDGTVKTIVESDSEELDIPMIVLVNGGTASAGELFAASLRDFEKASLVGETTFGKGIMQDTRAVAGGAVTLTVAEYQTVKGECYHGVGVTPDTEIPLPEEYIINFGEPDTEEDRQLSCAYDIIRDKL